MHPQFGVFTPWYLRWFRLSGLAMQANALQESHSPAVFRPETHATSPRRILVVDDDDDIRRLNTDVLIHHGYRANAAGDGAIAWQALMAGSYDLLITDNNMPNVTGVELLKKLHGARMTLPVILATGSVPSAVFIRYPWLRPAATLLKPYTYTELLDTVQEVLVATGSSRERTVSPEHWQGVM